MVGLEFQICVELLVDPLEIILLGSGPVEPKVDVESRKEYQNE